MSKFMSFAGHALSNLFHKPVTSGYPFVKNEFTDRTRGSIQINIDDCIFCGMCARKCPSNAITVDKATKTWSIERMGCVQCAYCAVSCPKNCLTVDRNYTEPSNEKTVDTYQGKVEEAKAPAGGEVQFKEENCIYCTLCAKKCPVGAITVDREAKTWSINREECVQCGACVEACRKDALSMGGGEEKAEEAAASGNVEVDIETCVLCGLCAKKCPVNAIEVDRANKTWSINRDECIQCGACVAGCPKKCLKQDGSADAKTGKDTVTKA